MSAGSTSGHVLVAKAQPGASGKVPLDQLNLVKLPHPGNIALSTGRLEIMLRHCKSKACGFHHYALLV